MATHLAMPAPSPSNRADTNQRMSLVVYADIIYLPFLTIVDHICLTDTSVCEMLMKINYLITLCKSSISSTCHPYIAHAHIVIVPRVEVWPWLSTALVAGNLVKDVLSLSLGFNRYTEYTLHTVYPSMNIYQGLCLCGHLETVHSSSPALPPKGGCEESNCLMYRPVCMSHQ
jgi:hypothetical protein